MKAVKSILWWLGTVAVAYWGFIQVYHYFSPSQGQAGPVDWYSSGIVTLINGVLGVFATVTLVIRIVHLIKRMAITEPHG